MTDAVEVLRIDSLEDERLDAYVRLTERELRCVLEPQKGIFIAESAKVIERAVRAGYEPVSFNVTRGALAAFRRPRQIPVTEFLGGVVEAAGERPVRVCVLEGIVDHTNVGAIFRSAAALNVDGILVSPTCCDPLYRRSARVSMGTVFQVPWTRIGSEARVWPHDGLAALHDAGFSCAAMALTDDSVSLDDPALQEIDRLAIFMGTEGAGLGAKTISGCDRAVRIPMAHGVDSLNVAAASAVAFWQLCPHVSNEYHYQPGLYH